MGRTKTSRYRNWRKQMRKRGQSPPRRKSYTWDYMSPGPISSLCRSGTRTAEEGEGIAVRIIQHYWNQYKDQPVGKSNRPRPITREEPCTWDTPNAAREREQIRKMEKAMDGVGWTALVIAGLLALLVIIVQVGKRFYGW